MKVAILAPGPSLPAHLPQVLATPYDMVIAVNNVYQIAPWADILVAQDVQWWCQYSDARQLPIPKYSTNKIKGVLRIQSDAVCTSSNSGLCALEVARLQGATEIHLYGFTMDGTHYFGKHPEPLRNTPQQRLVQFKMQFRKWFRENATIRVVAYDAAMRKVLNGHSEAYS